MEASAQSSEQLAARKSDLRRRYRAERALLNPGNAADFSWLHVVQSAELTSVQVIASYLSYGDEPTTIDINQAILAAGKTLLLPRLMPDKDLEWVAWNGDAQALRQVGKNLWETIGSAVGSETIGAFIVPALHINQAGYRLGQGGGSYDRALARSSAWKVGLIYPGELTNEELPVEPHDQRLSAAATPTLIVRFK